MSEVTGNPDSDPPAVLGGDRNGEGLLVFLLFLILFLASADNQLLIPLVPLLSGEFGVSISRFGWIFSAYALSAALFNLILGPMTDRWGRLFFLRIGLVLFGLQALLTARADSFWEFFGLRAGMGVAAGLLSTCTAGYVGDRFPYERRGRVMGFVLSSYFAALVLGVPISAWIADRWHWRYIFYGSAALAAAVFLGSFRISAGGVPSALRRQSGGMVALLRTKATRAALVTSFLISGGTLAFLTFISGYLSETFSLSTLQISLVFLISGIAAILASPLSGWLSDRWTKRRVFLWANSLLVVPLIALPWLGCGPFLFGSIFVISLGISFRQTALQTLQTELISGERRGSFLSLRNCFSQLGISFSVLAAGQLYASGGYAWVTTLAGILTLGGSAILLLWVPDPGERAGGSPSP